MPLPEAKTKLVAQVFAAAPHDALQRLEMVLGRVLVSEPQYEPVHALAIAEIQRRRLIAEVFEPIIPLSETAALPRIKLLTRSQLAGAWALVVEVDPEIAETIAAVLSTRRRDEPPPRIYDEVCLKAASLVQHDPDLCDLLKIAPILRQVQERAQGWINNLNGEAVANIRLAFKDALDISDGKAPLFWEAVFAMLDEPWRVVRLISAATDRPTDRYLASSELAALCERLLDEVDRRVASMKRFDPDRGEAGAVAQAASVFTALQILGEFEEWLTLNRYGPWGERIVEQKVALALSMEARLRDVEPAVAKALPTQPARGAGKSGRPSPRLDKDPQPLMVNRAEGLLALLEACRPSAPAGGFAALRAKTIEALDQRLTYYCDDLIDVLHQGEHEEPERIHAFIEIAANFISLIQGPQSAQIVRRRAAAA